MKEQQINIVDLVELGFDENDEYGTGITAMSVVTNPAIKARFVTLSEQYAVKYARMNDEKRILLGAALIPDMPIYRRDADGREYYAYMTAETIEKLAYSFLKNGRQNNATIEHAMPVEGLSIVESWIVNDNQSDKSVKYGMDYPEGTWMIAMKVNNDEVWNQFIRTGKLTGFSIEAMLQNKRTHAAPEKEVKASRIEAAIEALFKANPSLSHTA
jgi:hypothetical protein